MSIEIKNWMEIPNLKVLEYHSDKNEKNDDKKQTVYKNSCPKWVERKLISHI